MNQMIKDWFSKKRGGDVAAFLGDGKYGLSSG
jgi:hypothetical protein